MISHAPYLTAYAAALQGHLPADYPLQTVHAEVACTKPGDGAIVISCGPGTEIVRGNATYSLPCAVTVELNPTLYDAAHLLSLETQMATAIHETHAAMLAQPDGETWHLITIHPGAMSADVNDYGYVWTHSFASVIQF